MPRREEWWIGLAWPDPDRRAPWSFDPDLIVTLDSPEHGVSVSVELHRPPDAAPYVTGVAVRPRTFFPPAWDGKSAPDISPRKIQRLPLARFIKAAVATAATAPTECPEEFRPVDESLNEPWGRPRVWYAGESFEDGSSPPLATFVAAAGEHLRLPRGDPPRGHSSAFYEGIARVFEELTREGHPYPAKEIARRKNVPANRVHQWTHTARKMGFLGPPPGKARKD